MNAQIRIGRRKNYLGPTSTLSIAYFSAGPVENNSQVKRARLQINIISNARKYTAKPTISADIAAAVYSKWVR